VDVRLTAIPMITRKRQASVTSRTPCSRTKSPLLHDSGTYTQAELAELFGVGRSTIYRTIDRMRPQPVDRERPFAQVVAPSPHTRIQRSAECEAEPIWRGMANLSK
jgi:hypothetical protein